MPIHFSQERWQQIAHNYTAWWEGSLKRPLLHITSTGHDPERAGPKVPNHHFMALHSQETPAANIIDARDYGLSTERYLGDAFPSTWLNFGAGSVAAYLGAQVEPRDETVWFHPPTVKPIEEIQFASDPANAWLLRTKAIAHAAMERWEGTVQVGMADLGGALDILSTFRPGTDLLTDVYLNPTHVHRLVQQLHQEWFRSFDDINTILRPVNPGYTAWTPIFSTHPYYILQCDFAYMIGPDMFDEFVKPELIQSCTRLVNPFYHLDGVGQLAHLDSLLSIPELKGIQWVPGDGKPSWVNWPDVYRRIRDAGKRIQVWGSMADVDRLIGELGSGEGIVAFIWVDKCDEDTAREFLTKHL